MNEALRDWVTNVENTFCLHRHRGGAASLPRHGARFPHAVIAEEPKTQGCRLPKAGSRIRSLPVSAAGSNAIGLFHPFLDDPSVEIYGRRGRCFGLDKKRCGLACRRQAGRPARQSHLSADE